MMQGKEKEDLFPSLGLSLFLCAPENDDENFFEQSLPPSLSDWLTFSPPLFLRIFMKGQRKRLRSEEVKVGKKKRKFRHINPPKAEA